MTQTSLFDVVEHMKTATTQTNRKTPYEHGRDCAINGANETNCHFAIFSTQDRTKEWERGKRDAELSANVPESQLVLPDYDITARKHLNNPQSVAANPSSEHKSRMHQVILAELKNGDWTAKEIAHRLGIEQHKVSGRCAEMKLEAHRLMWIRETGERRDKGAVLTLTARGRDEVEKRTAVNGG